MQKKIAERKEKGAFEGIVKGARLIYEEFFSVCSGSPTKFEEPLKMVASSITKLSTKREAISVEERLCVRLRYPLIGGSYLSLVSEYRIGVSTIGNVIAETTSKILNSFCREGLMNVLKNNEDWIKIVAEFERIVCVKLMGKHIIIQNPAVVAYILIAKNSLVTINSL